MKRSANKIVGSALRDMMPHLKGYLACDIDLLGDRPNTMSSWNLTRQLVYARPTLQCILTQTNEQGCFRPHIFSQCHDSLSFVLLRPRLFSKPGSTFGVPIARAISQGSHFIANDYQLLLFVSRSMLLSNQTYPASAEM